MSFDGDLIWGALLVLLGLGAFYGVQQMLAKQKAAQGWPTAVGKVLVSRLQTHESDGSTMYRPYVQYRYTAQGKEYTHDKYELVESSSNLKKYEEKKLAGFAVGATVPVYYNPVNPADAVLVAKTSRTAVALLLVAGIALVVGGVALALPF
jgi:predicted phage tail protein